MKSRNKEVKSRVNKNKQKFQEFSKLKYNSWEDGAYNDTFMNAFSPSSTEGGLTSSSVFPFSYLTQYRFPFSTRPARWSQTSEQRLRFKHLRKKSSLSIDFSFPDDLFFISHQGVSERFLKINNNKISKYDLRSMNTLEMVELI